MSNNPINLALRFLLELAAIASLVIWIIKEFEGIPMLLSTLLFFPTYFLLYRSLGNHGLWLAFILFMTARGITMSLMTKSAVYSKLQSN